VDIKWSIEPGWSFVTVRDAEQGMQGTCKEYPGFHVEETRYQYFPSYDDEEKRLTFATESELMEHLVKAVTENVAFYRHLESK
jgi:hypothetical protein